MKTPGCDLNRHDSLLDGAAIIDVVAGDPHDTGDRGARPLERLK